MNADLFENLKLELRRGCVVLAVLAALRSEQYGYTLRKALAEQGMAIDEGTLAPQPVDALAHILLAAVDEAALFIANAARPRAARDASASAMRSVLAGLTGKPHG